MWVLVGRRRISSSMSGTGLSRRRDCPLNVTSAFSEEQVRFVALKRERIVVDARGIL